MARVIHFDLLVEDVSRASVFYEAAFGWRIQKWEGPMEYWFITTGEDTSPGIDGGMSVGDPNLTSVNLTLGVDDLDEVLALVRKHGGSVVRDPSPIQGTGYLATVSDTEGNQFGLMQFDPSAK